MIKLVQNSNNNNKDRISNESECELSAFIKMRLWQKQNQIENGEWRMENCKDETPA